MNVLTTNNSSAILVVLPLTISFLLVGCRSSQFRNFEIAPPHRLQSVMPLDIQPSQSKQNTDSVKQVAFEESVSGPEKQLQEFDDGHPATLEQFEQLAFRSNPVLAEQIASIDALRGQWQQAGLPPNPVVGINAEDINEEGASGRYGVYVGRKVVMGNKLQLSQNVIAQKITAAEQRLELERQRILNRVRIRFYDLLVAQEQVKMTRSLVQISREAVEASTRLFDAEEISKSAVLQSQVELSKAELFQRQANNRQLASRRKLAGLVGKEQLPPGSIAGDPTKLLQLESFEATFDQLLESHPQLAAMMAEVEQSRRQLIREQAEPLTDVTWQTTMQYDTVSDNFIAGFQVGLPIPTQNVNQGAIASARDQMVAANRRAEQKAVDLRQELANAYRDFQDARLQLEAFDTSILPKAKETLELVSQGYQQGEVGYLQLLTAQQTYTQLNLSYFQQLSRAWQTGVTIRGLLIMESPE